MTEDELNAFNEEFSINKGKKLSLIELVNIQVELLESLKQLENLYNLYTKKDLDEIAENISNAIADQVQTLQNITKQIKQATETN